MDKEFNLSERIDGYDPLTQLVVRGDVKEFIRRDRKLLAEYLRGNISWAEYSKKRDALVGDKLIGTDNDPTGALQEEFKN